MRFLPILLAAASALPGATYYVTIAGLGGEPDYEQRFTAWAKEIDHVVKEGGNEARVYTLSGADATRERVKQTLAEVAATSAPGDAFVLMMIGHGTFDGVEYKINLPGPDVTATELAAWLDRIPASRQLVANMTSASGGSIPSLQKERRAVITATKSGAERNAVVFARYWVAALQDAAADTDKNEVITALEAFTYADRKTTEFYATQKRLATEHPILEDTGQGDGVREPSPANGHGLVAGQFTLLRIGATQIASQDPAKQELLAKKEQLEQEIDKLKYEKAAMPLDEYRTRLTALLLELAKTQEALEN
ncbi:MAG: hypothetical protein KIT09_07270 [Bryobacteraceae bacterium]|nr:hypothetical protein [Bryobacteraceae bacterium]